MRTFVIVTLAILFVQNGWLFVPNSWASEPIILKPMVKNNQTLLPGWSATDAYDVTNAVQADDPGLKGALVVYDESAPVDGRDEAVARVTAILTKIGFDKSRIEAAREVENIDLLDEGSDGMALIGEADDQHFAAALLDIHYKGRMTGTQVRLFVAPEDIFERAGGWMPVAEVWFRLDGEKLRDDILAHGKLLPKDQAGMLSQAVALNIADQVQLSTVNDLAELFIANIHRQGQIMRGQMCTGVSGTGPDAGGVSGLNNTNC